MSPVLEFPRLGSSTTCLRSLWSWDNSWRFEKKTKVQTLFRLRELKFSWEDLSEAFLFEISEIFWVFFNVFSLAQRNAIGTGGQSLNKALRIMYSALCILFICLKESAARRYQTLRRTASYNDTIMYSCIHVCIHVCMYVCMYVYGIISHIARDWQKQNLFSLATWVRPAAEGLSSPSLRTLKQRWLWTLPKQPCLGIPYALK